MQNYVKNEAQYDEIEVDDNIIGQIYNDLKKTRHIL